MHNVKKWQNILLKYGKSLGFLNFVFTARSLKYVWPFSTLCMKGLHEFIGRKKIISNSFNYLLLHINPLRLKFSKRDQIISKDYLSIKSFFR